MQKNFRKMHIKQKFETSWNPTERVSTKLNTNVARDAIKKRQNSIILICLLHIFALKRYKLINVVEISFVSVYDTSLGILYSLFHMIREKLASIMLMYNTGIPFFFF